MYRTGTGSVCQAGLQSAWGTPVTPDTLINMTGETIKVTVNKGDESNLLAKKTRDQADVLSMKVEGGISAILRPEFSDWLFEAVMGGKTENVYTLVAPNTELPLSTIVLSRGGIVKTYPDVTVKSIKISAAAQDYVKVDIDFIGVKELSASDEDAKTIQNLSFTLPSYRCTQATLKYAAGGTAKASVTQSICVESCDITIDNGIEEAPATYCSGLFSGRPVMGRRTVSVDFSIPYSDAIDIFRKTYYMDGSSPTVALLLKFTTSNADENIEIYIPNVNITSADGNVGGAGIIDTSFNGEALSVGSTEPITVTVNHDTTT
ncbi:MAG: hypothetical protein J5800_03600 [Spirochaetales bacterium]|nr:hypothetical protein [Spirochaetales bacterium]